MPVEKFLILVEPILEERLPQRHLDLAIAGISTKSFHRRKKNV